MTGQRLRILSNPDCPTDTGERRITRRLFFLADRDGHHGRLDDTLRVETAVLIGIRNGFALKRTGCVQSGFSTGLTSGISE